MVLVYLLCVDFRFYGIEQEQSYIQSKLVKNINDFSDIVIHSHPIHFYQYGDYHREQAGIYLQLLSERYRRKMINLGNQTRLFPIFYSEIDNQWEENTNLIRAYSNTSIRAPSQELGLLNLTTLQEKPWERDRQLSSRIIVSNDNMTYCQFGGIIAALLHYFPLHHGPDFNTDYGIAHPEMAEQYYEIFEQINVLL